jgi:hypothetical protein
MFKDEERGIYDDYSLPAYQIFIRFAVAMVERGRALELLDHAGLQRRRGDIGALPSWVPDWTFKAERNGPKKFSTPTTRSYSASGQLDSQPGVVHGSALSLSGFLVDTLMFVQPDAIIHLDPAMSGSYYNRVAIKKASWALEGHHRLIASTYPDVERAFANLLLYDDDHPNTAQGDNATIITDPFETYREFMSMPVEELWRINSSGTQNLIWHYMKAVRECNGLKFSVTERGFMTLVPLDAQEGDRICIFGGQTVPFLLRRDYRRNGFLLVGDAYVHGIMAGESLWFQGVSETDVILV